MLIEWSRFVVCLGRVRSAASHVRSLMGVVFVYSVLSLTEAVQWQVWLRI